MIRSMTAFAQSEQQSEGWTIRWELRSVNHRYLDVAIRLPESMRSRETSIRERIGKTLGRGKVECTLKFQPIPGMPTHLSLNRALVRQLLETVAEVEQMMGPSQGFQPMDILRWPDVVNEAEPDPECANEAVFACLDGALAQLLATRRREGERIAEMIRQRCGALGEQLRAVRARYPEVIAKLREKLLARLAELPLEPDIGRLEQEMAIIAQRIDIAEELDRLDAHLIEIEGVLKRTEPVGRRLDFLMQELNREANTLASKSADTETTRAAVELKVLIEQMREQIQNIE